MKKNLSRYIIVPSLFAALAVPVQLAAQDKQSQTHRPHHYKLIDLGSTFGGPQSYFVPGSGEQFFGSSVLNNGGTVAGFADTSLSDPFPSYCFWNCNVTHAFRAGSSGHLIDLGALPGGGSSAPMWISPNGLIAGLSENGDTDGFYPVYPQLHAVLWQQGKITDLGTLDGGYQSVANAVNSAGQVVGAALNTTPDTNSMTQSPTGGVPPGPGSFWLWGGFTPPYLYQTRAFLWDKQKGMQDLGTLPGGTDAQASVINEAGQVVGLSYTASTKSGACFALATSSFIWEKDKGMMDLGGFGGTCTLATALNNRGQVIGVSNLTGDLSQHAFLWEHGSLQDLGGSLGGDFTGAFALNEQGHAVGFASLPGDIIFHATLWRHVGNMTDLGVLGDDQCSYAAAINANGQVVGGSMPVCNSDTKPFRAFLWEDGSIFDLNALIPSGSALYLQTTYAINDRGEIAGVGGDLSGNQHAFLLIPCDENHSGIEGCDYEPVETTTEVPVRSAQIAPASAAASAPKLSVPEMMMRPRFSVANRYRRFGALPLR